ncbi:G-type lectin S-receptor-like serine/threonine-protein [Vigna angularis]|uniref:G-type lectin S-receptor-like serine/threonine-protein n=1 Tax=Phaseolus angularis TaxID=3914 RepID=A0A8T0LHH8_PHAAN|nr:G-type lectin S-receptor-like serine/threonine-protein [Vigna angularis]
MFPNSTSISAVSVSKVLGAYLRYVWNGDFRPCFEIKETNPSPELYTLRLKPSFYGEFELVFNDTVLYSSIGNWSNGTFLNISEMIIPFLYAFHFVAPFFPAAAFCFFERAIETSFRPPTMFCLEPFGQVEIAFSGRVNLNLMRFARGKARVGNRGLRGLFGLRNSGVLGVLLGGFILEGESGFGDELVGEEFRATSFSKSEIDLEMLWKWSMRFGGSEEKDWDCWSWNSMEVFSWEKCERTEEVDSVEDSGFVERLWGRFESLSTIAKCFFCFSVSSSMEDDCSCFWDSSNSIHSTFMGELSDASVVAVKRLERPWSGEKEFRAKGLYRVV